MIYCQDMEGKKYCTDQYQCITFSDEKSFSGADAQKVQATKRKKHCDPDKRAAFLFQENPDDWDDDYVTCGDETGFSNGGVFDPELLEVTCQTEKDTAADTASDQCFAGFLPVSRILVCGRILFAENKYDRNQSDGSDDVSDCIKGKTSDVIHTDTLCHKSHTPDGGSEQKQQRVF